MKNMAYAHTVLLRNKNSKIFRYTDNRQFKIGASVF